jgi:hypothetical protein
MQLQQSYRHCILNPDEKVDKTTGRYLIPFVNYNHAYPVDKRGSFLGGKAARREADQSPPTSKNVWSYTLTPNTTS